jgi:uncharacterized membrane protein YfcA
MDSLFLPLLLALFSFSIGFIAPMAGVGGGVMFSPLMLAFTNIDINIVRATGLTLAMTTSLFAGSRYLEVGITRLNIALYNAFFITLGSVTGAIVGIHLVEAYGKFGEGIIRLSFGALIFIVVVLLSIKREDWPTQRRDRFTEFFALYGKYFELSLKKEVEYSAIRAHLAPLPLFGVGFISGAFGVGGGWALVPVLNLIMSLPIKVAVASSEASLCIGEAASVWVYFHHGALTTYMFLVAVPFVMLGARLGSKVALKIRARIIRYIVIAVMIISAVQLIRKGLEQVGLL